MKLPRGVHVKPERMESFYDICRQLDSDFTGAMRLKGVKDEKVYTADLLIDMGFVIAASFNFMNSGGELLRDEALDHLRNNLAGSSGKLDIFGFNSDEMRSSIESNAEALMEDDVKVHELGVKIKSSFVKKSGVGLFDKISGFVKKPVPKTGRPPVKDLKSSREDAPIDSVMGKTIPACAPSQTDESGENDQVVEAKPLEESDKSKERKKARLQKIKETRLRKITDRITLEKEAKAPIKKIVEGMKVKTTIDKLYELIIAKDVVRINDELSKEIGVSKTQIEEWAMILEEHNLVELHYPAIGEPEIKKI